MVDRISSLDSGYTTGDLSLFPVALDTRDSLYRVANNAETVLKQALTFNGKMVVVESTDGFPEKGIVVIGSKPGEVAKFELIYYDKKTVNTFQDLKRGFAGSIQGTFIKGTFVGNSVSAEIHNAIKDALINMEIDMGLALNPDPASLNGILKAQETRFLAPKPLFRAFPIKGKPPLKVRFQNFSGGDVVRNLWDFGDGGSSIEESPTHAYIASGKYTVKLNVTTTSGAQGSANKIDYITVDIDEGVQFFYVEATTDNLSNQTAQVLLVDPTTFTFVDQSDGNIIQRNWDFGDGEIFTQNDPDIHDIQHIYSLPGSFRVSLINVFDTNRISKLQLPDLLIVT